MGGIEIERDSVLDGMFAVISLEAMNLIHDNPDLPPPRKQESDEIDSLAKLAELNEAEILEGYRWGWRNREVPIGKSKSFMHGWLNSQVDCGHMKGSAASQRLAYEFVNRPHAAPGEQEGKCK